MTDDEKRSKLIRSRNVRRVFSEMADWRSLTKKQRDLAIAALHIGRQVEEDMGFAANAESCTRAIRMLEATAELGDHEFKPIHNLLGAKG